MTSANHIGSAAVSTPGSTERKRANPKIASAATPPKALSAPMRTERFSVTSRTSRR